MPAAVARFDEARQGNDAWMLGRFVAPAERLAELGTALLAGSRPLSPWRISAIARDGSDDDLRAISSFNDAEAGRAVVDAVEYRPHTPGGIGWLAERAPAAAVFVEVPATDNPAIWMSHIANRGFGAKIRTGGVTATAFPTAGQVVAFLQAALSAGVPFKATAGLHHAVRGQYRLTYDADAACAPMYGYLNVLLATAALHAGWPAAIAERVLLSTDAATLTFSESGIEWGGLTFDTALLHAVRSGRLAGFGSCSFDEPADELRALTLHHH